MFSDIVAFDNRRKFRFSVETEPSKPLTTNVVLVSWTILNTNRYFAQQCNYSTTALSCSLEFRSSGRQ